ncbi:MAG: hypothetical protein ABIO82_04625 [Ginsengibacter sp.]
MKKHLITLFSLIIIAFVGNAQTADSASSVQRNPQHKKFGNNMQRGKGRHASEMKDMNFSDSQKEQMKNIRSQYRDKMNQLDQDRTLSPEDLRTKKNELRKEQKDKFESTLTPEKKEKLVQRKQQHQTERKTKEQNGISRMKSSLELNDAQVSQLQTDQEAFKAKAKAIKENNSSSADQKKDQLMQLRKTREESVKNILSTEQWKKREEMKQNRPGRMKARTFEKS